MTTTNLDKPTTPRVRWRDLQPPIAAAVCIFCLLLIGLLAGRVWSAHQSAAAVPTPQLPIIIIASPLP
jgi:hypothetical protein